MHVEVKSSAGVSLIPVETRHFSKRRVHLRGEITMDAANALDDAIALLNDESTTEPIDLYITSAGGDIEAGRYIYDIITAPGCAPIRAHAQGVAASMAAIIFAAASSRDMLPNTRLMSRSSVVRFEAMLRIYGQFPRSFCQYVSRWTFS